MLIYRVERNKLITQPPSAPREERTAFEFTSDGEGGPEVRVGWPNRASMVIYLGWVSLAAVTMLR